jgi:hypothetical protein
VCVCSVLHASKEFASGMGLRRRGNGARYSSAKAKLGEEVCVGST